MTARKKTLKIGVARISEIPKFAELSTEFALDQCKQDVECNKYVPEHWSRPKAKKCREYLWAILATFQHEFVKQCLRHAQDQRRVAPANDGQSEAITICEEVAELFAKSTHTSCK